MIVTLTIAGVALACVIAFKLRQNVYLPIKAEQVLGAMNQDKENVYSEIRKCRTDDDCLNCYYMIIEFDRKFRPQVPYPVFIKEVEDMWYKLNAKTVSLDKVTS